MDFSAGAAIGAGLVATAVMTAMLYMGIALMPRWMTMNLLYMLGTMMTRGTTTAYLVGAMMHGSMGVVFALGHVGAYQVLGLESGLLGWGILFGFLHWIRIIDKDISIRIVSHGHIDDVTLIEKPFSPRCISYF